MFIVEGELKLLLCFPLNVGINDIINYRTNYLLRGCRRKVIANKLECCIMCSLIESFREIALNHGSDLNKQFIFLDFFAVLLDVTLDRQRSFI